MPMTLDHDDLLVAFRKSDFNKNDKELLEKSLTFSLKDISYYLIGEPMPIDVKNIIDEDLNHL